MLVKKIVTPSGQTRWQGRVKHLKMDRRRRFLTRAEAMRWSTQILNEFVKQSSDSFVQFRQRTMGELVERYEKEELPRLRLSSQKQIRSTLRWWDRFIPRKTRLDEITAERLMQCSGLLVNLKPSTSNTLMNRLGRVLSMGVQWGWMPVNPMHRVKRAKVGAGRFRVLTAAEQKRLLFWADLLFPQLHALLIVALSVGPRKTELRKLTWSDYDPDNHRLYLRDTKNGEPRALPLYGKARDLLLDMYRKRSPRATYVFPGLHGCPIAVDYWWPKLREKAGLQGMRFHDLRHTCASYLAMEGATIQEIGEVMGHKDLKMVRRYAHLTRGHTDSAVEKMNLKRVG